MIVIFRRGTDCRVLRNIRRVSHQDTRSAGRCVLFHHARGDGLALTESYVSTYDAVVATDGHRRLLWIVRPDFTGCAIPEAESITKGKWRQSDG
jgi:hypothetical protein